MNEFTTQHPRHKLLLKLTTAYWHNYCTLAHVGADQVIFCESTIFGIYFVVTQVNYSE